jgi:hypothetical protein
MAAWDALLYPVFQDVVRAALLNQRLAALSRWRAGSKFALPAYDRLTWSALQSVDPHTGGVIWFSVSCASAASVMSALP